MDASPHEDVTPDLSTQDEQAAMTAALDEVEGEASAGVMHLRMEGVPLALLADLADPSGPSSPTILQDEGLPDVAWWGADAPSEDDGDEAAETPTTDEV